MHLNLLVLALIVAINTNLYPQSTVSKVRMEFTYSLDEKIADNSGDDLYNTNRTNKLVIKLFDKINLITNDSVSFLKFQFSDEIKYGNNGYIYLSNQNEVNSFKNVLSAALESISNGKDFENTTNKYKIEIGDKLIDGSPIKVIRIHEISTGTAFISLKPDSAIKLFDWMKDILL